MSNILINARTTLFHNNIDDIWFCFGVSCSHFYSMFQEILSSLKYVTARFKVLLLLRPLKSPVYIWQILGPVRTGTKEKCPNPHLLFFSLWSPRTKMSSCLYHLRKRWKFLPHGQNLSYGISKQGRPYSMKHLVTHSYTCELHVK